MFYAWYPTGPVESTDEFYVVQERRTPIFEDRVGRVPTCSLLETSLKNVSFSGKKVGREGGDACLVVPVFPWPGFPFHPTGTRCRL